MTRHTRRITLGSLAAVLVGCGGGGGYGGGGGGGGGGMNLSSAPGEPALAAYIQASHSVTLKATDTSGNNWTLQDSFAPNSGTTTFNGTANAYSYVETLTIDKNGALAANNISTNYFLLNPLVPLGTAGSTGTPYAVVTSSFPLPMTITIGEFGDKGPFYNITAYHDSTVAVSDADQTTTYFAQTRDAYSLLLCTSSVVSNVTAQGTADGIVAGTETDCYSVTAAGTATLVSITVTVSGTTLMFQ